MIREELTYTPAPACDTGRHCRCAIVPGLSRHPSKARVWCAQVGDRTDHPHAGLQAHDRVKDALTQGRRARRLDLVGSAVHDAAFDCDDAAVFRAFALLHYQQPPPHP